MRELFRAPDGVSSARNTAYWTLTLAFCVMMLLSASGHLTRAAQIVEVLENLGYPDYFIVILGVAKLAGIPFLLRPGSVRLKEWAYAGYTYILVGGFASHIVAGSPFADAVPPLIPWLFMAGSYVLHTQRPQAGTESAAG